MLLQLLLWLALGYLVTCLLAVGYACHAYWCWRTAWRRNEPLPRFASWHTVLVSQQFWKDKPWRSPYAPDVADFAIACVVPGVNLVLLLCSVLGYSWESVTNVVREAYARRQRI